MQEDEQLKKLLRELAVEKTSVDFTQNIMQRIEAIDTSKQRAQPLLQQKPVKVLMGIFILVCMLLVAICIVQQPSVFPFHFTIQFPAAYISQITSFLVVFWVVMIANLLIKRKHAL